MVGGGKGGGGFHHFISPDEYISIGTSGESGGVRCNAGHSDREVLKGTLKHVYVNLWARAKGQGRCLDKGASLTEPLTSERLKPEADQKHVFPRRRRLESRRVSANRDKEPLSRRLLGD